MILTQYCHRLGKECDLKAVISVCACMDLFASKHSLENQYINYTASITNEMCDRVERYAYVYYNHYINKKQWMKEGWQCQ